jgi:hypothetical protein
VNTNGHPGPNGLAVIANALAEPIERLLPAGPTDGPVVIERGPNQSPRFALISNGRLWYFRSEEIMAGNGWTKNPEQIQHLTPRDIENVPRQGVIATVDRTRFGPDAFRDKASNPGG